ncbi:amino acid permease-domain-containing protein [Lophiotrema nucula]|uniref:Amino acid permease-domain-containing protein n=1 Tax=Lophiotrema nucula TaxID=690887 RepID=A0A6A5Z0R4_9PLEO|nr:amino acid permease-domain-containing protein [Lophiotrema nucula]
MSLKPVKRAPTQEAALECFDQYFNAATDEKVLGLSFGTAKPSPYSPTQKAVSRESRRTQQGRTYFIITPRYYRALILSSPIDCYKVSHRTVSPSVSQSGSMSQNSKSLYPPDHEMQRLARRPLAGTGSVSVRSKSASSSKHETKSVSDAGPSNSSQVTAVGTEAPKVPPVPTINETYAISNARIHTDPSSSTSRSTKSRRENSDDWDERNAVVPRSNLTVLDVAALIVNKMIGTGWATTPGSVLLFTKSKGVSVALWTVGGLWTGLFLLVYLEFGNALPFNGGELIYLDEIYRRPELLATVLFSGYFICLGNSYGNSIQFAKHVLISADQNVSFSTELDTRLVRYIAISVVTLVCIIHGHSSKAGLFLNKLLAWYKVVLLIVVFVAGMRYSDTHGSQWNDETIPANGSSMDGLAAMVLIFYTYQGWENANYVAGEIRALEGRTPARTLKFGAFFAVGVVWILYVLVAVAYYKVLDYATITGTQSDLGVALYFAPKVFGSALGLKICLAIAAFGNVLAVTYTSAKVKQTIAIQRFLPFWKGLIKDDETPKGALVLHWITSVLMIAFCPTNSDGYSFAIGLYTYGHIFFSMWVALGLFDLKRRMHELDPRYRLTIFRGKWLLYTCTIIFALGNLLVLIFAAKAHQPGKIPRFWWPVTFFLILLGSLIYWGAMMITRKTIEWKGEQKTIGQLIGFEVLVYNRDTKDMPEEVKGSMTEALAAKIDGSKRRVEIKTTGRTKKLGGAITKTKDFITKWLF